LRLQIGADGRGPALQAEPAYAKGLIEVQDEGSQLAALLAAARPGMQVLDLCAGAGGKTLALAAGMDQKGQIYATDVDGRRLMPIYPRLERAGVRNVQVRAPRGSADILSDLSGKCDIVFVDAPCTGTGTWRRNPDAKWRTRPGALYWTAHPPM
jgi:16S rRNA (cytosine967-C5)-methyltransferase